MMKMTMMMVVVMLGRKTYVMMMMNCRFMSLPLPRLAAAAAAFDDMGEYSDDTGRRHCSSIANSVALMTSAVSGLWLKG